MNEKLNGQKRKASIGMHKNIKLKMQPRKINLP